MHDAFVRFDNVQVITAVNSSAGERIKGADYRLASTLDPRESGATTLIVRLADTRDNVVFWSRSFELPPRPDDQAAIEAVIKTVAGTLIEPYGAIYGRELARHAAASEDSAFSCVRRTYEYLWTRDASLGSQAAACLEQAVAADPAFSRGFSLLAAIYLNKYRFEGEIGADDSAMIERALMAARTAVRLNPNSVRALAVLADVLMAQGQFADAKEAAERAIALNPLDPIVSFYYAAIMVFSGDEIDKGDAALRDVFAALPDPPQRAFFVAFVANYLRGDLAEAARYATQLIRHDFGPALLARALAAWKAGDRSGARRAIERLLDNHPAWKTDPHNPIRKIFPLPEMAGRFVADFAAARRFAEL